MRVTPSVGKRRLYSGLAVLFLIWSPGAIAQSKEKCSDTEWLEASTVWQQTSGERRALSYQAFALARMMLDRDLRLRINRKRAVIVDVDETILDNAAYQARQVKTGEGHTSQRFTDWVNRAEGIAIPGALEFLRYANSRGVRVFYITNRKPIEKEGTATNLRKLGFPDVTDETLLTAPEKGDTSKEPRRLSVGARYRVALLIGDNLNDFARVFETSKTVDSRTDSVEQNKAQFGARFIVLPNSMYGDWELAIYNYEKLTNEQKSEKRKSVLKGY
jgi:5'-nucleotidase (lipoprotein e(P4) family)